MPRLVTTVLLIEDASAPGLGERVRQALTSSAGVLSASYNSSTRLATVLHDPGVAPTEGLIAKLEIVGCRASLPKCEGAAAWSEESLVSDKQLFVLGAACSLLVICAGFLPRGDLAQALMLVFAAPAVILIGLPMLLSAVGERTVRHEALSASAALVVFAISIVTMLTGSGRTYFDAAAVMLALSALGRYIEGLCLRRARLPTVRTEDEAGWRGRVVSGGGTRDVFWEEIEPGEKVIVAPGECVPADGEVIAGVSAVDERRLFGGAESVEKLPGSTVYAGSTNGAGTLKVEAAAAGSRTLWARRLAEAAVAVTQRAGFELFAGRVAALFGFGVIAAAAGTAVAWSVVAEHHVGAGRIAIAAAAVLASAAPAGAASAATVALVAALGRASRYGIVVRSLEAFDVGARADVVCFNKTGTVSESNPQVVETVPITEGSDRELLALAAGVERRCSHPLAEAVLAAAATRGIAVEMPRHFREVPGEGAQGDLSDGRVYVGTSHFLESKGVELKGLPAEAAKIERRGLSAFFVAKGDRPMGLIAVADPIRDDADPSVKRLKSAGYRVALLSGDNFRTTFSVAEKLGFPNVFAALSRDEKADEVWSMNSRGQTVVFVGSGLDLAPVMERASLGIGVGPESWDFGDSAQVLLPSGALAGVARFLAIARRALKASHVNMFLGLFVSSAVFPLAAILPVSAVPGPYVALVPIAAAAVAAGTRAASALRGLGVASFDADGAKEAR